MPIRIRKSMKVAPGVRVTVGRKSGSVSVGGKGVRRTYSTTGRKTDSVGIPGSGVSHQTTEKAGCLTLPLALLAAVALAACAAASTPTPEVSEEATAEQTATTSPTATAAASPTSTPEPEAVVPEIVSFFRHGDTLSVRLHNPNANHGLIRSPFELAILDEGGAIIAVEGTSGLPGAASSFRPRRRLSDRSNSRSPATLGWSGRA